MKIYAIGDIHGEFDKIKALVGKLVINDDDLLVFMGDYIDRGKKSFEVIEYLSELDEKHNCVFLKGNHEDMFIDYLNGVYERDFLMNGGTKTLKSYYKHGWSLQQNKPPQYRKLPPKHHEFIYGKLRMYYETEDYIFVHAALWPGKVDLETHPKDIMLWERNHFIQSDYDWGKKVIFGHTAFRKPLVMDNKIGIDTGACFNDVPGGGVLTCLVLPDEVFIQEGKVEEKNYDD